MGLIRNLPLSVRLPLIRGALSAARIAREPCWRKATAHRTVGPLVVSGFLGEALGVGRAADATADALQDAGYDVVRESLRPALRRVWSLGTKPPVTARPGGIWLIHANAPEAEAALMAYDCADWIGRYRIGYWAWETTQAPPDWARVAPWFDEIWVPSRFTSDAVGAALEQAGLGGERSKLRIMPHPVRVPDGVQPRPGDFGLEAGVANALVMFDGRSAFARKNPWGAIEAWTRAFPQPRADARLIIKGSRLATDPRSQARLQELAASRSDVRLLEADLSEADLWALLASVDLLISLHRAEGFGLVAAEAMALGKPVVMTGWSGVTDYADNRSAILIPSHTIPVQDPTGAYRHGLWAEPDLDAAAAALHDLIDHPDRGRAIGVAAPARIAALSDAWAPRALQAMPFASLIDNSDRKPAT